MADNLVETVIQLADNFGGVNGEPAGISAVLSPRLSVSAEGYLDWLRNRYAGKGNSINFVATFLEGMQNGRPDVLDFAEHTVLDNLQAAINEHPVSESAGEFAYELDSRRMVNLGKELDAAVYHDYVQIPEFELPRNRQNLRLFNLLQEVRRAGNPQLRAQTIVEFSPTPSSFAVDPEIQRRGYLGNDTVLFYSPDGNGGEHVRQLWFPRLDVSEYRNLLEMLLRLNPADQAIPKILAQSQITDVDIMSCSGNFSAEQVQLITDFAQARQREVVAGKSKIEEFAGQPLRERVTENILPVVKETAEMLLGEAPETAIQDNLARIMQWIDRMQFELRLYIKEVADINTFSGKIRALVDAGTINFTEFAQSDVYAQVATLRRTGFTATGCGFGSVEKVSLTAARSMQAFGSFASILNTGNRVRIDTNTGKDDELYIYECPDCHTRHNIDVPNGVYVLYCVGCGKDANCN